MDYVLMDMIFRKAVNIFSYIGNDNIGCAYKLALKADMSYAHVWKLLKKMEADGLIVREKNGRNLDVSWTKKGVLVRNHILKIKEILRGA